MNHKVVSTSRDFPSSTYCLAVSKNVPASKWKDSKHIKITLMIPYTSWERVRKQKVLIKTQKKGCYVG